MKEDEGWQVMSIAAERTRLSDAICIAASKVTLKRPRGFSREQEELDRVDERREEERCGATFQRCIFTLIEVESCHTRSQVGYWRVVILVHTFKRERRVITPVYKSAFFFNATKRWGGGVSN